MKRVFEAFDKVDEFYDEFKSEFHQEQLNVLLKFLPDFKSTDKFEEYIAMYAVTILSVTQSVIDKDKNYPDYRKKEDLEAMQVYYSKAVELSKNKELAEVMHQKSKELLVKYYPKLIDLSAVGFRLLELNLKLFNLDFVANFNRLE